MPAVEYVRHESEKNGVEYFRIGKIHPDRLTAERNRAASGSTTTIILEGPAECLMKTLGEVDVYNLQGRPIPNELMCTD